MAENKTNEQEMEKKTTFKVKAFMDNFKSEGFNNLYEPLLNCIPFHYEDEIWEFELVIQKIKQLPFEDYCDVEVKEVKNG